MSIVLCCIRKVSGNFQQPGLSAKGGTDSCYVNVATATRSSYKYSHIYALLINFILLGDNSNEHYSMEKEITLSKTKKFFFNKDHRTAEKHRLLYGRAGSGTFHYKKGTVSRVSCSSPLFS